MSTRAARSRVRRRVSADRLGRIVTTTTGNRRWWHVLGSLPAAVAVLVACNTLYISLVAFGNITDFDTNYAFVQHVLSMDTTNFGGDPGRGLDPDVMWRAITDPVAWTIGYIAIVVWECVAAIVLIIALVHWVRAFVTRGLYDTARSLSSIGLVMIVVLFFAGFIDIGGEWFSMWRSTAWNGEDTAFRNCALAAITLVLVHTTAQAWLRKVHVDTGQIPTAK
jgi:predicted small integral membrane protein